MWVCGGGLLAEELARRGARVTAIDLAPAMIQTAQLHAAESGLAIDYRVQDANELAAQAPHSFDVVCCMEMLEHVADPAAFLGVLGRLVKPGGALVRVHAEPQCQVLPAGHRRRGIRAAAAAAGHA